MSTAPDYEAIEKAFEELRALSKALLECDPDNIEEFERLMDLRAPIIAWLHQSGLFALKAEERSQVDTCIEDIQTLDAEVAKRLTGIMENQAEELRQISTTRKALDSYKFPYVPQDPGVENEG